MKNWIPSQLNLSRWTPFFPCIFQVKRYVHEVLTVWRTHISNYMRIHEPLVESLDRIRRSFFPCVILYSRCIQFPNPQNSRQLKSCFIIIRSLLVLLISLLHHTLPLFIYNIHNWSYEWNWRRLPRQNPYGCSCITQYVKPEFISNYLFGKMKPLVGSVGWYMPPCCWCLSYAILFQTSFVSKYFFRLVNVLRASSWESLFSLRFCIRIVPLTGREQKVHSV